MKTDARKNPVAAATLAALWCALPGGALSGKPGDLDPAFGAGGKATLAFGGGNDSAEAVVVQGDGRIVSAGRTHSGGGFDFALARHLPDGTLDTTFGAAGKAVDDFAGENDAIRGAALQADGKIVVAGVLGSGGQDDFGVARYSADGVLDTSFGGGLVNTDFAGTFDQARAVAVQPSDQRIVVAGWVDNGDPTGDDFALARYEADGTLHPLFGAAGKASVDFGGTDEAVAVAIQPDGKIVAAGNSDGGGTLDFALARFTTTGVLDATFGTGGKVTTPIGAGSDGANAVVIQPDGKILVAGYSDNGGQNVFALVRYLGNGALDTAFGAGGKATTVVGSDATGYGAALQNDGRILVAGYANNGANDDFALVRYKADGTLDTAFGVAGKAVAAIGAGHDDGSALAVQADGKIVVVGNSSNGANPDFALARFQVALGDARVGANGAVPRGNDLYNLTGAGQTQALAIRRGGGTENAFLGIQNDGPVAASFTALGTRGDAKFAVQYLRGAANVTAAVTRGTLNTGPLAPGAISLLKARITARTNLKGRTRKFSLRGTAVADATARDVAIINARSR